MPQLIELKVLPGLWPFSPCCEVFVSHLSNAQCAETYNLVPGTIIVERMHTGRGYRRTWLVISVNLMTGMDAAFEVKLLVSP